MPSLRRQARRRKPFIAPEQVGSDSSSSSPLPAAVLAKYYKGMPKPESLPCPRCESPDTKFCYYNNYKLSQPRYYCKSCKRYWTDGGSLLDVPIGGATRKKKCPLPESASASASASTVAAAAMDEMKGFVAAESSLSMAADLSSILSNNDDELLAGEGEDWLQSSCSTGFVDLLLSGGVDPTEIFGFSSQPSFSAPTGELKSKNSCNYPTLYHAIIQEDNKIGGTNGAVFDF